MMCLIILGIIAVKTISVNFIGSETLFNARSIQQLNTMNLVEKDPEISMLTNNFTEKSKSLPMTIIIMISGLDNSLIASNPQLLNVINKFKSKEAKQYDYYIEEDLVPNWSSLFLGTPKYITGITGNVFTKSGLSSFDSLIKNLNRQNKKSKFIVSSLMKEYLINSIPNAVIIENKQNSLFNKPKNIKLVQEAENPSNINIDNNSTLIIESSIEDGIENEENNSNVNKATDSDKHIRRRKYQMNIIKNKPVKSINQRINKDIKDIQVESKPNEHEHETESSSNPFSEHSSEYDEDLIFLEDENNYYEFINLLKNENDNSNVLFFQLSGLYTEINNVLSKNGGGSSLKVDLESSSIQRKLISYASYLEEIYSSIRENQRMVILSDYSFKRERLITNDNEEATNINNINKPAFLKPSIPKRSIKLRHSYNRKIESELNPNNAKDVNNWKADVTNNLMEYCPFIILQKNSDFSTNPKYYMYSKIKPPIFNIHDISATLSALFMINFNKENTGRLIDEAIRLNDFNEEENKFLYLKLRNQHQLLYANELLTLNHNSEAKSILNKKYRSPSISSSEYYFSEVIYFNNTLNSAIETSFKEESSRNSSYTLFSILIVSFIIILVYQQLTYSDILRIISCYRMDKDNYYCFILSVLSFSGYIFICLLLKYLFFGSLEFPFSSIGSFCIWFILTPTVISYIMTKIVFILFFYANFIGCGANYDQSRNFFFYNLFRNVQNVIYNEKGLAYVYLYRVYSLFSIISFSFLLTYFAFSTNMMSNSPLILYYQNSSSNEKNLNYLSYVLYTMVYLIMILSQFFNYPFFSAYRQIYDSLFILYDNKILNLLNYKQGKSFEKEALESSLIKIDFNYDSQSIYFYENKEEEIRTKYFSNELAAALILHFIVNNNDLNISNVEEQVKQNEALMGRDINLVNDLRRSLITKGA